MKSSLQLRHSASLKLSPQMRLAIKLLHFSSTELEQEIELAVASNPFLEYTNESTEVPQANSAEASDTSPDSAYELDDFERSTEDYQDSIQGADANELLERVAQTYSLRQHLFEQLQLSHLNPRDLRIGEALIDSLNDDGYCLSPFDDIRQASLLPDAQDGEIETVLHVIQHFDPLGVAARSVSECLLLQLAETDADPDVLALAQRLAKHHLDTLAQFGLSGLQKKLPVNSLLLTQAFGLLKTLEPKPGARFNVSDVDYIQADFSVEKQQGRWKIQALGRHHTCLKINRFYQSLVTQSRGNDADYLKQHFQEARWLIKSIQTRHDTLRKVVHAIVKKQQTFLESGLKAMQPLSMRNIAEQVQMHESSISRACSRKYLATPHGLFELNAFFSVGISNLEGQMQSATAIQAQLALLIKHEDPHKPLSDTRLESALSQLGISVARRTIAKYREELHILPSHLRHKSA